jgi:hypothetical protein
MVILLEGSQSALAGVRATASDMLLVAVAIEMP